MFFFLTYFINTNIYPVCFLLLLLLVSQKIKNMMWSSKKEKQNDPLQIAAFLSVRNWKISLCLKDDEVVNKVEK